MDETRLAFDPLISAIAELARTPGRATTSGADIDVAYPPIAMSEAELEESRLGIQLPLLLKRLYTEVGNGGFGPGYGLLSLSPVSFADRPISFFFGKFRSARNQEQAEWATGVVPLNDWVI